MSRCIVETCTEQATHPESGLCNACYSGLYYWQGATPTELVRHKRKLARCEARMDMKLGNVKTLKRRRAR